MVFSEILKQIIRSKWTIPLILGFIISLGIILFLSIKTPDVDTENIEINQSQAEIESDINSFYDTAESEDMYSIETEASSYISAEATVEYLFTVAKIGDDDFFPTVFLPERFEKDFFKFELEERANKVEEAMSRISRGGTLERVQIIRNLLVLEKDSTRVVVDIYYEDLKSPIRINIILKHISQAPANQTGSGTEEEVYFVNSSVWEIIKNIESE